MSNKIVKKIEKASLKSARIARESATCLNKNTDQEGGSLTHYEAYFKAVLFHILVQEQKLDIYRLWMEFDTSGRRHVNRHTDIGYSDPDFKYELFIAEVKPVFNVNKRTDPWTPRNIESVIKDVRKLRDVDRRSFRLRLLIVPFMGVDEDCPGHKFSLKSFGSALRNGIEKRGKISDFKGVIVIPC